MTRHFLRRWVVKFIFPICAALALALGLGMADDTSALRQLLDAFALSYQKISFAISLP